MNSETRSFQKTAIPKSPRRLLPNPTFHLCSRSVIKKIFAVCALACFLGCGSKKGSAEDTTSADSNKPPATVEEAAKALDLATLPLMDGAKSAESRHVANLSYVAPGDPKKALEFQRKAFGAQGWKELPNSSISDQSASAMFARDGFVVSLSVIPFEASGVSVRLLNLGNVKPGKLPVPPGVKAVYQGDSTAMYETDAAVPATADAIRNLFVAQGWVPYGEAGDTDVFKKNAILATVTVSSAPARGGKTMIQYSNQLISSDIPAPQDVEDLRYVDEPPELTFATRNQDAVLDFYRKTLAAAGWKSTMDKMIDVDGKPTMIFRNPAKEMLTLSVPYDYGSGKLGVSVRFQSAAEIAELDRRRKEAAPKLRAAAEAKAAQEAKEAAELAEKNKLPKVAVTLPTDAKDVKQTKDSIKFTVGKGKAKAAVEFFRKQFRDAGWKEKFAAMEGMSGAASFSKEDGQSVTVTYTDTPISPSEVSLSAMRAELEAAK
ncbi:MAG TPA: hypothetical protein VIS53_09870 [Candidatus Udaeobacter sp.]